MFRYSLKIVFLLVAFWFPVFCANGQPKRTDNHGSKAVSRGKYLVEQVAMCVECHTPRDKNGELSRDEYLNGAPIPVKAPPYAELKWALKAPAIAGLPGYSEAEGVRLLTRGITRDGRIPNAPTPPFRLSISDAEAVVAFLKSLE